MGILDFTRVTDKGLPDRLQDAALNATYARNPNSLKNALTGWFHVDGFGAVLDGATDDSAAINAAVSAASAAGGGVVYIPTGTAGIGSAILAASNVAIRGNGRALTILKALTALTTAVILGTSGAAVSKIAVTDLTIDANFAATGKAIGGLQITNGDSPTIRNVRVTNAGGSGVLFQGLGSGGGTPGARVEDCDFDGVGLANGTTGHAIWFKDNSTNALAINNTARNIVGGMGVGMSGSGGTGFPTGGKITGNHITMAASATGFEPIGITTGCSNTLISDNTVFNSQDNGISVSADFCTVVGNRIDGAYNHGIASSGNGTIIVGNHIRNVGREDPAAGFAFISATATSGNYIAMNKCVDDQAVKTTTYGVKLSTSGGTNNIFGNTFTGHTGANIVGSIASDQYMTFTADGLQTRRLSIDILQEAVLNAGLTVGSTIGFNGLAYTGSGRLGSGQHVFSSNLAASRPATYAYAQFGQAADISQWATNANDNTQTVRAGVTSTGRIYSTEGIRTKDLGAIDGKTSAQIDALFLAAPSDGTMAVGSLSSAPVFLHRRGGKWNYSAATQIA